MSDQAITAIPTRYAGCHFRSRLEARWAVFFDHLGIEWEYEPEGLNLPSGRYLPDFYLPICATYVEVRGSTERVDLDHLLVVAGELSANPTGVVRYTNHKGDPSSYSAERGPRLLLLGYPSRPLSGGDWGWLGTDGGQKHDDLYDRDYWDETAWGRYGFGLFHKNGRPWWLGNADLSLCIPLTPTLDLYEQPLKAFDAYAAARSARFEHGQSGAT